MVEKKDPDPFPHLPRRSFYAASPSLNGPSGPDMTGMQIKTTEPLRMADGEVVLCHAMEAKPKKRGRPVADKPWEREGISRMTWYRRRKEKGDNHG